MHKRNYFGTYFSDVNIHKDSENAPSLSSLAYTQGNDVHFAPGQYNPGSQKGQELLGHELAHVVQQREGRVKPDGQQNKADANVNTDEGLEKEADEQGKQAAQGKMAGVKGRGSGMMKNRRSLLSGNVAQLYTKVDVASQSNKEWNAGEDLRVADTGMTATSENISSKACYALPDLIKQSNRELTARESGVELEEQTASITGTAPDGSGRLELKKVIPKMSFSTSGSGMSQTAWTDCGKMSREVMGKTRQDESPHGVYTDNTGNLQETGKTKLPSKHRDNILVSLGLGRTPADALKAYNAMTPSQREAFDKKHGLNKYVSPDIGEAYAGHDVKGFNFHWGGVILKSGGDNVTLENYVKTPAQDTKWYFQTYGPPTKPGQTWDEQWDDSYSETYTTRTSTRSIEGITNKSGVRLVDKPSNWDDSAHYELLAKSTKIKKISTKGYRTWIKVEVLDGSNIGKKGYIMKNYFEGL